MIAKQTTVVCIKPGLFFQADTQIRKITETLT